MNGPFIPTKIVDGNAVPKEFSS